MADRWVAGLPVWVLDLIADLIDEETLHPRLYADTANGYARYDWCPAKVLDRVPEEVRYAAQVVAAYRDTGADEVPAPVTSGQTTNGADRA